MAKMEQFNYQEAKEFLDSSLKKEGVEFSEEILESIFRNVEVDDEGRVSHQDFASSYTGATSFLQGEIFNIRDKLADNVRMKREYEEEYDLALKTEK